MHHSIACLPPNQVLSKMARLERLAPYDISERRRIIPSAGLIARQKSQPLYSQKWVSARTLKALLPHVPEDSMRAAILNANSIKHSTAFHPHSQTVHYINTEDFAFPFAFETLMRSFAMKSEELKLESSRKEFLRSRAAQKNTLEQAEYRPAVTDYFSGDNDVHHKDNIDHTKSDTNHRKNSNSLDMLDRILTDTEDK